MPFADHVEVVGVDGDDTLWRCQDGFDEAEAQVAQLLAPYAASAEVMAALAATERANLATYGFGVKAWTLNVLQTVQGYGVHLVPEVLALGRSLLTGPVEVLPGAREAVEALAATHRVVLVTKGDLVDQQRKLLASGLRELFSHVEIVSDKTAGQYAELLRFLQVDPARFLMVGNSEVSDVRPVLELGGWAVHVPYRTTWVLERVDEPVVHDRLMSVGSLSQVPPLLARSARPGPAQQAAPTAR
ncbi:MAG: HAD family hydrolase [Frankiales bacterium]|nr:HAD family hydrolase [Frankiales bacterium]